MLIKISNATPKQLDWMAATIIGFEIEPPEAGKRIYVREDEHEPFFAFSPSTDPSKAYLITFQVGILSGPSPYLGDEFAACIGSDWDTGKFIQTGSTPLVAAMRCYAMSKLGTEAEVPDWLSESIFTSPPGYTEEELERDSPYNQWLMVVV